MKEGFFVNGVHSCYTLELRILQRNIGSAPKDDYTERVPFSSVTYDFGRIYGLPTYGERTISYTLEFICFNKKSAQDKIVKILGKLRWSGRKNLYDDLLPDYHFRVREPNVSWSESHGVYTFNIDFPAAPEFIANIDDSGAGSIPDFEPSDVVLPDINGDGSITPTDASMILSAYSNLATGNESGLTPDQERAADANMDGQIMPLDASLVIRFYSELATGKYKCTAEDWAKFLNDVKNQ